VDPKPLGVLDKLKIPFKGKYYAQLVLMQRERSEGGMLYI